jgi:hypothetical protein
VTSTSSTRLFVDVTAAVPVEDHDLDPARVAGVDLGIIHPLAVSLADQALLVSGRAVRAEERLHLEEPSAGRPGWDEGLLGEGSGAAGAGAGSVPPSAEPSAATAAACG